MVQVLTMPMLGNTMEIGIVVEWIVDEDESVSEDDTVVIVESEKASNEVTADQNGILKIIYVAKGEEVPPGTPLGVICGPDKDISEIDAEIEEYIELGELDTASSSDDPGTAGSSEGEISTSRSAKGVPTPAAPGARRRAWKESVSLDAVEGTGPGGAVLIKDLEDHLKQKPMADSESEWVEERTWASPSVRRLARELGVNLSQVNTFAEAARVSESDVRRATAEATEGDIEKSGPGTKTAETEVPDANTLGLTVTEERELSGMRRTIARRMRQSTRRKPHVTLNRTVSAERALAVVSEYRDMDSDIGLTDLLVCAAVEALKTHPEFNALFSEGTLSLVEEVNIGVAIDIEDSLVTPVLRDAASKTPGKLAQERVKLTELVQSGNYSLDDLQGGTFTISNLGMFGVDSFNPIINPPEIAILGVGRIRERDEEPELTLSLSFDHRVVDGAAAARFLDTLTGRFTAPTALLNRRVAAGHK